MTEENLLTSVLVNAVTSSLSSSLSGSLLPCHVTTGKTDVQSVTIPNVVIYAPSITSPVPNVKTLRKAQVNVEVQTYAYEAETELTKTVLDAATDLEALRTLGSGSVRFDNVESPVFNGDSVDEQDRTYTQQYTINVLFAV